MLCSGSRREELFVNLSVSTSQQDKIIQQCREDLLKESKQEYLGYITISSLKWEAVKISMWPDLIAAIQLPVQSPASNRVFRSGMLHRFSAVSL